MVNEYSLRCSLCGDDQEVESSSADGIKAAKEGNVVYICDTCQRKVQYESEQKFR